VKTLGVSSNNGRPEDCFLSPGAGTRDGSGAGADPLDAGAAVEKGNVGTLEGDGNLEVSTEGDVTGKRLVVILGDEVLECTLDAWSRDTGGRVSTGESRGSASGRVIVSSSPSATLPRSDSGFPNAETFDWMLRVPTGRATDAPVVRGLCANGRFPERLPVRL
jgi:hypothetical protein